MAIKKESHDSKVKIQFNNGSAADGRMLKKSKTYSNVKAEATDEGLYSTVETITKLQDKPVLEIVRIDESVLISE